MIRIEWDTRKDHANQLKHGISFAEAETVFVDENGRLIADPEHSQSEDRFILLGMSAAVRILSVVHCYREDEEVMRIISARGATRRERDQYLQGWRS